MLEQGSGSIFSTSAGEKLEIQTAFSIATTPPTWKSPPDPASQETDVYERATGERLLAEAKRQHEELQESQQENAAEDRLECCRCGCGGLFGDCILPTQPGSEPPVSPRSIDSWRNACVHATSFLLEGALFGRTPLSPPRCLTRPARPPTPEMYIPPKIPETPSDERGYSTPSNPPTPLLDDESYDENDPSYIARKEFYGTPRKMRLKKRRAQREEAKRAAALAEAAQDSRKSEPDNKHISNKQLFDKIPRMQDLGRRKRVSEQWFGHRHTSRQTPTPRLGTSL